MSTLYGPTLSSSDWDLAIQGAGLSISSNQITASAGSATASIGLLKSSVVSAPDDQWGQLTISNYRAYDQVGVVLRMDGSANGYAFRSLSANVYRIRKITAGSEVSIGSADASVTPTTGDVLYLEIQGTTLKAKVNGTDFLTTSDSTWSSGQFGAYYHYEDSNNPLTNVTYGGFTAGGATIIVGPQVATAPTLTTPLGVASVTSTTVTCSYDTDTASGKIYAVAVAFGSGEPSKAQIKASLDSSGSTVQSSVTDISASVGNLDPITGLTEATQYDVYAFQELS